MLLLWQFAFLGRSTELVDLWKISDGDVLPMVVFLLSMAMLSIGWLWSVRITRSCSFRDIRVPVIVITGLLCTIFVLVYPATAIDVYIYAARSQLLTDHGLDPSVAIPRDLWAIDPFVQYASFEWSDRPSPYGPLWNLIAAPATAIGDDSIMASVLALKLIMVSASLAAGALIHDTVKRVRPASAVSSMLFWLWSPVLLWEGIANSHNDVVLVLLVLAALWCWQRGQLGLIIPLLGASALLKVVTVILIPVAIVAIVFRVGWNRRTLRIAGQTVAWSILVLWISFAPFYDLRGVVDALNSQRGVWVTSPILVLDAMNSAWDWGLELRPLYERFVMLAIAAIVVAGMAVVWRKPGLFYRTGYEQMFWLLLLATSNLRPWYVIWLVALAAVLPVGMPRWRTVAWTIGALASYGYTGWIQNWTEPTWLFRQSTTVAITIVPVLLVTIWSAIISMRAQQDRSSLPDTFRS